MASASGLLPHSFLGAVLPGRGSWRGHSAPACRPPACLDGQHVLGGGVPQLGGQRAPLTKAGVGPAKCFSLPLAGSSNGSAFPLPGVFLKGVRILT